MSQGQITLSNSKVFGWMDMPYTRAGDSGRNRLQRVQAAVDAFRPLVDFKQFHGVVVVLNDYPVGPDGTQSAETGFAGQASASLADGSVHRLAAVILDPGGQFHSIVAQEVGHALGLNHSFGPFLDEYGDPYDVMSGMNGIRTFNSANFGPAGPGINAANRVLASWNPPRDDRDRLGIAIARF